MKRFRAVVALLLLICLLGQLIPAHADASLLPQLTTWLTDAKPVEVLISLGKLDALAPFDAARVKELSNLLQHLHLELSWKEEMGESWFQGKLLVADREAAAVNKRDYAGQSLIQLSPLPGTTYTTLSADPWGRLTGSPILSSSGGMDMEILEWLPQMEAFPPFLREALSPWKAEKPLKKRIRNAGTSITQETYTIPKEEVEAFQRAIAGFAAPGPLTALLKRMQFSGPQKLVLLLTAEGDVLSATYSGQGGLTESDTRQLKVSWKRGRSADGLMDDLKIEAPATKGKESFTATFSRQLTTGKNQRKLSVKLGMDMNSPEGNVKSILSAALTAIPTDDTEQVTGKVELTTQQGKNKGLLTILPNLQVDQSLLPSGMGDVAIQYKQNGKILTDFTLGLTLGPAEDFPWMMATDTVDIDRLEQQAAREEVMTIAAAFTQAVLPHLILLPEEDTLFLSRNLDQDVWRTMVDAARRELP